MFFRLFVEQVYIRLQACNKLFDKYCTETYNDIFLIHIILRMLEFMVSQWMVPSEIVTIIIVVFIPVYVKFIRPISRLVFSVSLAPPPTPILTHSMSSTKPSFAPTEMHSLQPSSTPSFNPSVRFTQRQLYMYLIISDHFSRA